MRRLYFRIYLHFVAIIVLFVALSAASWWIRDREPGPKRHFDAIGKLVAQALPDPRADPGQFAEAVEALAADFGVAIAVYDGSGERIAAAGPEPVPALPERPRSGRVRGRGKVRGTAFALPEGRWLVARDPGRESRRPARLLNLLLVMAVAIAIGAYPLAKRITRRLERLRDGVEALGAGDLGARVDEEGRDEVAGLARSFNRAAARIESLVSAQRMMLASASHELRTPLARMRMALELLESDPRPELRARIERDIGELDGLIEELLLATRLETVSGPAGSEPVDLLALAAEEGARFDVEVDGSHAVVAGDPKLLRHLLRNLFSNAQRHGAGAIHCAVMGDQPGTARVVVSDGGAGIPASERERIFEPFYRPAGMSEDGRGVGLGLYLVRAIAERHRGDVRYEAPPGGGSRFIVTLRSPGPQRAPGSAA